jgi:hypothetical protein
MTTRLRLTTENILGLKRIRNWDYKTTTMTLRVTENQIEGRLCYCLIGTKSIKVPFGKEALRSCGVRVGGPFLSRNSVFIRREIVPLGYCFLH